MKELEEYTDEELNAELKRRAYIKRVQSRMENMHRERWMYWEGTILSMRELDKGISVHRFRFHIKPIDEKFGKLFNPQTTEFKVQHKMFTLPTMPKVGDVVSLRYYIHYKEPNYIDESKIMKVVKRKGE